MLNFVDLSDAEIKKNYNKIKEFHQTIWQSLE